MFSPSHARYQHFFFFFNQETSNASPVILRVDPQGFYVYWTYQSTVSAEAAQLGLQPSRSALCEMTTLQVPESCTSEQTATLIPLSRDTPPRSGSCSGAGWCSQHQESARTGGVSVAFLCLSGFHLFWLLQSSLRVLQRTSRRTVVLTSLSPSKIQDSPNLYNGTIN